MAVLTVKHAIDLAKNFIESIGQPNNSFYMIMSKPTPWTNEPTPDVAEDTFSQFDQEVFKDLCFGKRIELSDVNFLVKRYDWAANTVYAQYDHEDGDLFNKNFYIINNENQVYKCIHNNFGKVSTVKPNLTTTSGVFNTTDGYVWKYMFTIPSAYMNKFADKNYIPVVANTFVQENAIPGSIQHIDVFDGGEGYEVYEEGYVQRLIDSQQLIIEANSSNFDNFYSESSIYLKTGLGGNQIRKIKSYDALNKIIVPYEQFETFLNLKLSDISDTSKFLVGEIATQKITRLTYLYYRGFFTEGNIVKQTDTGATGELIIANTSVFQVVQTSTTEFNSSGDYPVFNTATSGTESPKTGNASITAACTVITGTGTAFNTDYAAGDFIRVGSANTEANIRRIVTVTNSTSMTVNFGFSNTLVANLHYKVLNCFSIEGISVANNSGEIVYRNINGAKITYDNSTVSSSDFVLGETVDMVDSSNTNQLANGIISFIDNDTMILSDVDGVFKASNTSINLYVKGKTSLTRTKINAVEEYKNITISTPSRSLTLGQKIYSNGASATVESAFFIPNEKTQYIISPTVTITGDGSNALAYSIVNTGLTSTNSVYSVIMIDPGTGYTSANVTITANGEYGSGALARAIISPTQGHGSNPEVELAAKYVGVSTTIDNFQNEQYEFLPYGEYRKVGIIKNPEFSTLSNPTVWVSLKNLDRAKLNIANKVGTFAVGEVVVQPATNASGTVVYSNASFLEIKNYKKGYDSNTSTANVSFFANVASDNIIGLSSNAVANVKLVNTSLFAASSNSTFYQIYEDANGLTQYGANGTIAAVTNSTLLRVSNVVGRLQGEQDIFEPTTNAYATVEFIRTTNNSVDVTNNFGKRFNQTSRITLASKTADFSLYETVKQNVSLATGTVISVSDELDISYTGNTIAFTVGESVDNLSRSGNGIITYANTTFLKLSAVTGSWESGDSFEGLNTGANATIDTVYSVLVLNNVENRFQNDDNLVIGQTSGAEATINLANTISYPDLVRDSGDVIYIENVEPVEKTINSKEDVRLVIKF